MKNINHFNKRFQKVLIATACITSAGCTEALDKAPDGQISMAEIFADNFRTGAFLNTAYKNIPGYANTFWFATRGPVVVSDEAWDCDDFEYYSGMGPSMYNGQVSSDSYPMTELIGSGGAASSGRYYSRFYESIRFCNFFLERIDEANVSNREDKNRWTAEAHLLRAWYYMELLRWYGTGVPLIEHSIDNDIEAYSDMKKPSYLEVVELILTDCEFALKTTELPWRITSGSQAYRVTKALAEAIKSRVILYAASPLYNDGQNLWERAYRINMNALQNLRNNGYSLYSTVATPSIFQNDEQHPGNSAHLPNRYAALLNEYFSNNQQFAANPSDKETIYTSKGEVSGPIWNIEGIGIQGNYKCGGVPTQEMVDAYETTNGEPILDLAIPYLDEQHTIPNYNRNNHLYDPGNPYVNRDPRFYASVYYNGSKRTAHWSIGETPECLDNYVAGREIPGYRTRIISTWAGEPQTGIHNSFREQTRTGYYLRKFIAPNSGDNNASINTPHEKIFRLGEIILNCAEAAAEANHLDSAAILVNQIRARVDMPLLDVPNTLSKEALILRVRQERRVEMAFEGHRYFDVRRWQTPKGDLSATDKWVTAMEITRNTDGSGNFTGYTYTRRPVRPTERMCYTNRFLKAPFTRDEAAKLLSLTGENWQNEGW
ncbi:MAG: RagB/SusD family nutrient uptake outer membrane protein [Bacteroidales bacterium]|jgi:hypothetical protein|nr:RagB/SusD family nutrient uptake outer membrane protein [Bacteroidales bacterium]